MTRKKEKDWCRLPNGEVVTDAKKYIDAWRGLAKPIEKALGLAVGYVVGMTKTLLDNCIAALEAAKPEEK